MDAEFAMDESRSFENIDSATFDDLLSAYPDVVPAKLSDLDQQRYEKIPKALKQRKPPDLEKDQVGTLVDWKLWVFMFPRLWLNSLHKLIIQIAW